MRKIINQRPGLGVTVGRITAIETVVADQGREAGTRRESAEVGESDRRDSGNAGPAAEADRFELHRQALVKPEGKGIAARRETGFRYQKMDRFVRGGAEVDRLPSLFGEKTKAGGIVGGGIRRGGGRQGRLDRGIAERDQATAGMEIAGGVGETAGPFAIEKIRVVAAIVEPDADELSVGRGKFEAVGGGPKHEGRGDLLQKRQPSFGLGGGFAMKQEEERALGDVETAGQAMGQRSKIRLGPAGLQAIESREHARQGRVEPVAIDPGASAEKRLAVGRQAVLHRLVNRVGPILGVAAQGRLKSLRPELFRRIARSDRNEIAARESETAGSGFHKNLLAPNRRRTFQTSSLAKSQDVASRLGEDRPEGAKPRRSDQRPTPTRSNRSLPQAQGRSLPFALVRETSGVGRRRRPGRGRNANPFGEDRPSTAQT